MTGNGRNCLTAHIWSVVLVALAGCESGVDIRGRIELGEPISLDTIPGEPTALGYLDGWVLVTSSREVPEADPDVWGNRVLETMITWIDPEGRIGETTSLGWMYSRSVPDRPRWIAWEDALWGSVHAAVPEEGRPDQAHYIRIVAVSPTLGLTCSTRPTLPVFVEPDMSTVTTATGQGGYHPGTLGPDGPLFGLSAVSNTCSGSFVNFSRALTISGCGTSLEWLSHDPLCSRSESYALYVQLVAHNGELGVLTGRLALLREDLPMHWTRFRAGVAIDAPRLVGERLTSPFGTTPVPSAVALDGGVIWLEASDEEGVCSFVRVMGWDGSNARDAPWQTPCTRLGGLDGIVRHRRASWMMDVLPLGGVALFVSVDGPAELDPAPRRAIVTALTADGRRAAEPTVLEGEAITAILATTSGLEGALAYASVSGWSLRRLSWHEGSP